MTLSTLAVLENVVEELMESKEEKANMKPVAPCVAVTVSRWLPARVVSCVFADGILLQFDGSVCGEAPSLSRRGASTSMPITLIRSLDIASSLRSAAAPTLFTLLNDALTIAVADGADITLLSADAMSGKVSRALSWCTPNGAPPRFMGYSASLRLLVVSEGGTATDQLISTWAMGPMLEDLAARQKRGVRYLDSAQLPTPLFTFRPFSTPGTTLVRTLFVPPMCAVLVCSSAQEAVCKALDGTFLGRLDMTSSSGAEWIFGEWALTAVAATRMAASLGEHAPAADVASCSPAWPTTQVSRNVAAATDGVGRRSTLDASLSQDGGLSQGRRKGSRRRLKYSSVTPPPSTLIHQRYSSPIKRSTTPDQKGTTNNSSVGIGLSLPSLCEHRRQVRDAAVAPNTNGAPSAPFPPASGNKLHGTASDSSLLARTGGIPVGGRRRQPEPSQRTVPPQETPPINWTVDYPEDLVEEVRQQEPSDALLRVPAVQLAVSALRPSPALLRDVERARLATQRILQPQPQQRSVVVSGVAASPPTVSGPSHPGAGPDRTVTRPNDVASPAWLLSRRSLPSLGGGYRL